MGICLPIKNMKILHVISDKNIGGAGVLLTSLLQNFDRKRVESVVALPRGSQLCERIQALGIPIRELRYPCDRVSPASVRELCGVIREEGADAVHANAALCARIAGKRCGKTVLHTRHCCFPPAGIWRFEAVRRLGGRWNRALSDYVIATADAAAENLVSLGVPREKIGVIINGSEPVREVSEAELATARQTWGLDRSDFPVGICARLEPCKGHETFLRAAKLLTEQYPQIPFRFLIVGTGSRREILEELARTLEISDRVIFTGFVRDMAPVYRLLRVNVNCSMGTETSCLALSEGMSAGVPAVVSDYGGNRAMIGDSEAGIVYPTGDVDALCGAIARIATDELLEQEMRLAARSRYEQKYTAATMTEQVTQVYERLIGK